jgi:ABC-type anion transport system duplicated permease subunit
MIEIQEAGSAGGMMDDLLQTLQSTTVGAGSAIAAAIIGIAVYLPKLLNAMKSDKADGNVLDRLIAHEKRMNEMDKLIHSQQIKLTRLQVLVIKLEGLISQAGLKIHDSLREEMQELMEQDK